MHIGNRDFLFHYRPTYRNRRLDMRLEFMLSIRKLMSVVKDVDIEAMPSSVFVNDDDDDDDTMHNADYIRCRKMTETYCSSVSAMPGHCKSHASRVRFAHFHLTHAFPPAKILSHAFSFCAVMHNFVRRLSRKSLKLFQISRPKCTYRFWLGRSPRPHLGSLQRSIRPLAGG